jgi:hypothetical protein
MVFWIVSARYREGNAGHAKERKILDIQNKCSLKHFLRLNNYIFLKVDVYDAIVDVYIRCPVRMKETAKKSNVEDKTVWTVQFL